MNQNNNNELLIRALSGRAYIYSLIGEFKKAAIDYKRGIASSEQGVLAKNKFSLELIIDYANFLSGKLNDYAKAEEMNKIALKLTDEHNFPKIFSRGLHGIGNIHRKRGDFDKALKYLQEALTITERIDDKEEIGDIADSLGILYSDKGEYDKALKYYKRNLVIAEELGDISGIAASSNNVGVRKFSKI